jgi:TetR/AcrR family transcriptional regulator, fatty acid metabolism regulator protein
MKLQSIKVKNSRDIQAEKSRRRIYRAAIGLFAEKGFDEASINDICEKAQCSVGAFYHYFPSKDSILEETFRLADQDFEGWKTLEGSEMTGRELILAYMSSYAELVESTGLEFSKRFYNCRNKIFVRKGRAMQNRLTEIIRDSVESEDVKLIVSPEEACEWLFVYARGIVFHWCLCEGNFDLSVKMRKGMEHTLSGIEGS